MTLLHTLCLKAVINFYQANSIAKIKFLIFVSLPTTLFATVCQNLQKWSISNYQYISAVLLCIAIDHIVGTAAHTLRLKDFSLKHNIIGVCKKISLCALSGILFELIQVTLQDIPLIYEYLKSVTRLTVLLYPAGSAFVNMSILTRGKFPPFSWIKRIQAFNSDLDLSKFRNPDNTSK